MVANAGSITSSDTDATAGDDQQTFSDFLTRLSEEEQELMRAQGHATVYTRPGLSQPPSWENTGNDLAGTGTSFGADEQIAYEVDEDM
jgi:hypothetical protein